MSGAVVRRILAATLLAGAILCARVAFANAASLEDSLAGQLTASATPALLAPIASVGRTGWDCKPEHAAASQRSHEAELPAPGS